MGGDEAVAAGLLGEFPREQRLPRERGGVSVSRGGKTRMELRHRRCQSRGADAAFGALGDEGEGGEKAAQAWVGHELAQEWLGIDGAVQQVGQRGQVDQQEGVVLKVVRGVGLGDVMECFRLAAEFVGQGSGCRFGFLGDAPVHHGHQQPVLLRKRRGQGRAVPLPGQRGREHLSCIGSDAKACGRTVKAEARQQQGPGEHGDPVAAAELHQPRQDGAHHAGEG